MRKFYVVLAMLLSTSVLFAAVLTTVEGIGTGKAEVTISLPLSTGTDDGEYNSNVEVGFSATPVEAFETAPGLFDGNKHVLTISGDHATGSLYAYWKIASNESITINLYLQNALTGEEPNNTIDWIAKATDVLGKPSAGSLTGGESAYGEDNFIPVYTLENKAGTTMKTEVGDTKLEITTASFDEKAVDDYSANIVLAVSVS